MTVRKTRPEEFEDRIIFTSMFNDIGWTKNVNYKEWYSHSEMVREYARKFPSGQKVFSRPWSGEEERWYGTQNYKPEGESFECRAFYSAPINSANQLGIQGAIANWCDEMAQQIPAQSFSSMEKSIAKLNERLYSKNWTLRK